MTAGAALGVWLLALAAMTALVTTTRTVIVFGPIERLPSMVAGRDIRIVDAGRLTAKLWSADPDTVRSLYRNGAWLVLPSRPGGCLGIPQGRAQS